MLFIQTLVWKVKTDSYKCAL